MTPTTLDPTCMHASTDDIGVHPRLDHPHFPHCKQRRPIQLVGESRKRRKAGISSVSATAQEPRHRQAGVAGGSETLRTCRIWSCNIRGWTDDLRRWTGLAGGPTVAADFPRGTTSTLSLNSAPLPQMGDTRTDTPAEQRHTLTRQITSARYAATLNQEPPDTTSGQRPPDRLRGGHVC